ncbi:hypothetical protein WK57_30605 [Burkholderia ubonensis]|uniref:Uncharacterized protein n=1 Tax=Burkholderia ubonensis TaxID=101571 RepID=A0AA40R540_9BURK|nr:hypothetical protein [Burkholderia ubonensis]KWZ53342.1 hypothetical protein WK57_30605 [Burkholderia ubonensis]
MTEDQINRRWVEILLDTLSAEKPVTIGPNDASCFINALRALLSPTQQPSGEVTDAARDVLAERRRQVEVEAMTPAGDDQYDRRQLALAGASYALSGAGAIASDRSAPVVWPWSHEWWKPSTPRRDLVKAAALIIAEIERLDRRPDCVRAADEACEDVQKLADGIDAARAQGGEQK